MLKDKILEYNDELNHIEHKRKELIKRLKKQKAKEFDTYFLLKCFDELFDGRRKKSLEKGLRNMIYSLKRARGRLREKTEWTEKYERAQRTCIECVVQHFHPDAGNIQNIKRQMLKCPFHEDKSPSMKVYLPDNNFHCFGCNAHGSPIDFVMKIKNVDFKEAVEIISYL